MMTRQILILPVLLILFSTPVIAVTTGYRLSFDSNDWISPYAHPDLKLTNQNGVLHIEANAVGKDWQNFVGALPDINFTLHPAVYVKIRSKSEVHFQLRLIDSDGKETNEGNPSALVNPQENFQWLKLDFKNSLNKTGLA